MNDKKEPGLGRVGEKKHSGWEKELLSSPKGKTVLASSGNRRNVSVAEAEWEKGGKLGPRGRLRLSQEVLCELVLTSTNICGFHIKCN